MISISTDSAKLILRILNRIDESLDDCGSYHKVEPGHEPPIPEDDGKWISGVRAERKVLHDTETGRAGE